MNSYIEEKNTLLELWQKYKERDNVVYDINQKIKDAETKRIEAKRELNKVEDEARIIQRVIDTKGECKRPSVSKIYFSIIFGFTFIFKAVAIITAVLMFIISLILFAIIPDEYETFILNLGFNPGLFVWIGSPAFGIICGIVACIICYVVCIINDASKRKASLHAHKNFDPTVAYKEALNKMKELAPKIEELRKKVDDCTMNVDNLKSDLSKVPPVQNNLRMPSELHSSKGVALLIQYISVGRANSIQEAINLYYQDVKDAARMNELKKQTAMVEEQLVNTQIAAENSARSLEENIRAANAAERQAAAAERSADANERAARSAAISAWANAETSDYARQTYHNNK